jgi:hypothetical protein
MAETGVKEAPSHRCFTVHVVKYDNGVEPLDEAETVTENVLPI